MRLAFFLSVVLGTSHLFALDWTLNGGIGTKHDDSVLEVVGTGSGSNAWVSAPVSLTPRQLYRFEMEASSPNTGGCLPCGPEGFSRDIGGLSQDWKPYSYVFRVPDNRRDNRLRVGQWESTGTFRFRNIETVPVVAIPTGIQSTVDRNQFLLLGDGEMILDDTYRFYGSYVGEGSGYHQTLMHQTAGFNTDRFTFSSENEVIYRFNLEPLYCARNAFKNESPTIPSLPFLSATLSVNVNHHTRGNCLIDFSTNGNDWTELGHIDKVATLTATLPDSLFPAEKIFVRVRAERGAGFQVNAVNFEAAVQPNRGFRGVGETVYAETEQPTANPITTTPLFFDHHRTLYYYEKWTSGEHLIVLYPTTSATNKIVLWDQELSYTDRILHVSFPFNPYRDARPGYSVGKDLWWAEPEWKISPTLPQPAKETAKPIRIEAAKNDFESFQLVVNGGESGIDALSLSLDGNLQNANGAILAAENVQIRYAYYHFVHRKTDKTGVIGDWPDALPPLEQSLNVEPNRNQPLWVTVRVPADAASGEYTGTLALRRDGNAEKIPFVVQVWNFALPEKNRHETAFGLGQQTIFRYHNARTEEERQAVFDLYMKNFADYRVSPYNPVPLDPIRVSWNPSATPPSATLDFAAFDRAMERAVREYNITGFRLVLQGMGSGTFHERSHGRIAGFDAGTPQYESMLADYLKKIETHLREKGWLEMAYVYWFDEPDPKDYEFVAEYTARLKKYAPGLQRMMTEEPNDGFIGALEKAGTSIDIWCPVSYCYDEEEARKRQALGERIWWYVCTGPKEPYCTLFIDHPGTELRVWYWQAFQREIIGSLVWESVYWTSSAAFPNEAQNPYDDPMGYVSGYSTAPGSKQYWGNGDGRFLYPPLEAATPGRNDGKAMIKPPVSSIRWEMIREGIQDYEMLLMLRDLKAQRPELAEQIDALLVVPESITSSMTDFTTDPAPIYERRRAIARLLEQSR